MPLIVYLDETGDHSLDKIDTNFPIFALVMLVCDTNEYVNKLIPMVYQLKMDCFGHEGVIIHSRDIRKAQGDFGFLTNPVAKEKFYEQINAIIDTCDFKVISVVIKKDAHKGKYGKNAVNPYDLSLEFAMERLLICLEQNNQAEVTIVAEARGKKEDDELYLRFLKIVSGGTDYYPADRFKKINFKMIFREKKMNIVGTQVADLIAYPTARFAQTPVESIWHLSTYERSSSRENQDVGALKFSHRKQNAPTYAGAILPTRKPQSNFIR